MIKINLLSEGKKPVVARKTAPAALRFADKDPAVWVAAAVAVVALLGIGVYWWLLRSQLKEVERQIVVANREIEELKPILKEVEDYKKKKAELEHKIKVINDLKAAQRGPVQLMDHVSRALPELLWLDRMDVRGSSVSLRGRAFNTNAVAAFLENLGKVPGFREPVLRDTRRRGSLYGFDINFRFSLEPPPEAATTTTTATAASAAGAPSG
jgi:type IV pilus assembly protein PilN